MNPNQNTPLQTLVVSIEQLTPENMTQLSQAGYSIMRDPNLLIFARPVPQQDTPQEMMVVDSNGQVDEEIIEDTPVRLPNRKRR